METHESLAILLVHILLFTLNLLLEHLVLALKLCLGILPIPKLLPNKILET